MGNVLGACAGLFGLESDEVVINDEVDERLAVEELLQDAQGEGYPVEITVECLGLPDKDKFSKSDPFVRVEGLTRDAAKRGEEASLVGRTETVQNNLNPCFITAIMVSFSAADNMVLWFYVYHESQPGERDEKQNLLGQAEVELASLVQYSPNPVTLPLTHPAQHKKAGQIILTAQKVNNVQEEVAMTISGRGIRIKGTRPPNPFLTIFRVQRNKMIPVAKTNVCRRTTNPEWNDLKCKAYRLCSNNLDMPLQFQVHSYEASGSHRYIGSMKTTLNQLNAGAVTEFPLVNEHFLGQKNYVDSGVLTVHKVSRTAPHSFLDYVKKGFEINCTLAVDLSSSNGEPITESSSLHFRDPQDPHGNPNDYMNALRAVCKVVGRYDKDQMFPVYGFGAVNELTQGLNECFPLSLSWGELEVQGADAIVEAYLNALDVVTMSEPTNLAPVIKAVMEVAHENASEAMPAYQLLVILTDGNITDMTETVDAVVEASYLPMSILIVGIGDPEDGFTRMKQLDDSKVTSVVSGKKMCRDVVNFISYEEYKGQSANEFARGALAEVPRHFLSWVEMSKFDIKDMESESDAEPEPATMGRDRSATIRSGDRSSGGKMTRSLLFDDLAESTSKHLVRSRNERRSRRQRRDDEESQMTESTYILNKSINARTPLGIAALSPNTPPPTVEDRAINGSAGTPFEQRLHPSFLDQRTPRLLPAPPPPPASQATPALKARGDPEELQRQLLASLQSLSPHPPSMTPAPPPLVDDDPVFEEIKRVNPYGPAAVRRGLNTHSPHPTPDHPIHHDPNTGGVPPRGVTRTGLVSEPPPLPLVEGPLHPYNHIVGRQGRGRPLEI